MSNGNDDDLRFEILCYQNIGGPKIRRAPPTDGIAFDHPLIDFTIVPLRATAECVFAVRNCSNDARTIIHTRSTEPYTEIVPTIDPATPDQAIRLGPESRTNDVAVFSVRHTPEVIDAFDEGSNRAVEIFLDVGGRTGGRANGQSLLSVSAELCLRK
jgi:hypothetical protein